MDINQQLMDLYKRDVDMFFDYYHGGIKPLTIHGMFETLRALEEEIAMMYP